MTYAISDLHGHYDAYIAMLHRIQFSENDTLYVLGDSIDRGAEGIKILFDIMGRNNVIPFWGNHEYRMFQMLQTYPTINPQYTQRFHNWRSDGGEVTYQAFLALNDIEKNCLLAYMKKLFIRKKLTINNHCFHLSHTIPERSIMHNRLQVNARDFLLGEPDYELCYYKNCKLITGHTPTHLIDKRYRGRIYQKNNHIAIDCGCGYPNGQLGCICLNTMEEFYVH